jgi:uncharacterized protein YcaQ
MALHAQGLTGANQADQLPGMQQLNQVVEQVNYVQIDTLNLIQRAQYIVLWSRLGSFEPKDFDRLRVCKVSQPLSRSRITATSCQSLISGGKG